VLFASGALTANEPGGSYFVRHWRGQLLLPESYWRNGLGGGLLLALNLYLFRSRVIPCSDIITLLGCSSKDFGLADAPGENQEQHPMRSVGNLYPMSRFRRILHFIPSASLKRRECDHPLDLEPIFSG
jgi:hypothetical protein